MKTVALDSGLILLMQQRPYTQTVSIHVAIKAGLPQEKDEQLGISHLLEHMLFKGTANHTAEQLSALIEGHGGTSNAFTDHEQTEYFVTILSKHWELGLSLLLEMLTKPTLSQKDLNTEKKVVLDEILRVADDEEACAWDRFQMSVWREHVFSKPVLGKRETVNPINQVELREYFKRLYVPQNSCIAVVGNFDEALLEERVRAAQWDGIPSNFVNDRPYGELPAETEYRKDCQQTYVVMGVDTTPASLEHPDRFALSLYNVIMGGNASSRLFQEIREKRGLAYSIASDAVFLQRNSLFAVALGTDPDNLEQVRSIILQEVEKSLTLPPSAGELQNAKNYLLGVLANTLESNHYTARRLSRYALFGLDPSAERFIQGVEEVEPSDLLRCAQRYIDPTRMVKVEILPER